MTGLRLTEEQFAALTKRRKGVMPNAETVGRTTEHNAVAGDASAKTHHGDKGPIVLREQIEQAGLPVPFREFVFHPTRDWRLDLAWPDLRLACEVDGMVHRIKGRFLRDLEKHNALVLAGWRHVRVTPRMIETGEALDIVRRALQ